MAWIGLVLAAPSLGGGLASRNVSLTPDLTTRQLAVLLHDGSRDPKPGTTLAIPAYDFNGREVKFRSGKLLSIFVGHCDTCSAVRIENELKAAPLNTNVLVVSNGTEKQMQELSKKLPGSARLVRETGGFDQAAINVSRLPRAVLTSTDSKLLLLQRPDEDLQEFFKRVSSR